MGYACPVCADPQSDATHLANHVPEWGELDDAELGERVAEHAEKTEFPQVFEDTTDRGPGSHGHGHGHSHGREEEGHSHGDSSHGHSGDSGGHTDPGDLPAGADALAGEALDEEAREAIAEAREMTRKRRENADAGSDGGSGSGTDEDDTDRGDAGEGGSDGDDAGTGTETE
jgi:hypothetical protein